MGPRKAETILKMEDEVGELMLPDFKLTTKLQYSKQCGGDVRTDM